MGKLAQRVEMEKMGMTEGVLFLLRRADIIAPADSLEVVSSADRAQAQELVTLLDGLPLALDQAGAYIEETGTDLSHYLELYKARRKELLKRRSKFPTDHPESVASTWSLSFQKIEKLNPVAVDLLRLCAFLQPDAIPEELLTKGAPELGDMLVSIASDPLQLDEAIGELLRFSLVRRHYESKTLTIHRLVQTVLKDEMDAHTQRLWAERTVRVINQVFSDISVKSWPICQLYFPHALVCAALIDQWNITFTEATHLLQQAGTYARNRSQYREAEILLKRAVMIREQVLGPEHLDTAKSLSTLASLYLSQGRDEQARSLIERAVEIYEQSLGYEHPTLADSLMILAALHRRQGDYERAESLLKRALAIAEQAYGPNDPYAANSIADLADLYARQKQYEKAEPLIKRALGLLDPEQETDESRARIATEFEANVLERLARVYVYQNKYEQAEQLFRRTLAIMEQVQEVDPITAQSLKYLADIYMSQDKHEQAEQLYRRSLKIWEQIMGLEHSLTEGSRYGLVRSYMKQSKYEQALTEYTQVITPDPNSALAYLGRGYVYLHLKESEHACADFAKYAVLRPKDVNAAWMVVYAALSKQHPGVEIAERLETIAMLDPQSYEACTCRGVALGLRGKLEEGLAELERALHLNAESEDALFWKGMICAYLDRSEIAVQSLDQALQDGLPPILLTPLYWLEQDSPYFYREYAEPLLRRYELA